jgi:branched-chain amino acid transport system substrate-binding protein
LRRGDYLVGVLVPKSGENARLGELIIRGASLAQDDANRDLFPSGHKLVVKFRDTEGRPSLARDQFLAFVEIDHAPIVIGSMFSSETKAFAEDAIQKDVVVLANGSSDPTLRDIVGGVGNPILRNWPSDDLEGLKMGEYAARTMRFTKGAAIAADDPYARGLLSAFKKSFEAAGGTLTTDLYEKGNKDFKLIVNRAIQQNPQFLYAVGFPTELGHFVREVRSRSALAPLPILSGVGIESDDFVKIAGPSADNIFYTSPYVDTSSLSYLNFTQEYRAHYKEEPDIVASVTYDAVMMAAHAIHTSGYKAIAVKNWLYDVVDYPGASGVTSFTSRGDVIKPISIKRIEHGKTFVLQAFK